MKKSEYLKPIPTRILVSWREKAETGGGGTYTAFDYKTARAMIFSLPELDAELITRDDFVKKETKSKKIRKAA
jgi:hypothetical protein